MYMNVKNLRDFLIKRVAIRNRGFDRKSMRGAPGGNCPVIARGTTSLPKRERRRKMANSVELQIKVLKLEEECC
jgi:hypothetical protein